MYQTLEKTINGSTYTVTQLPARRALKLKARLLKVFGPSLAQMVFASNNAFDQENVVKAMALLVDHLDDQTFEKLTVELLQGVRKQGIELTDGVIDSEFAGDLGTLFLVLWFVLEANYGSFFAMSGIGNPFKQPDPQPQTDMKKTFIKK